MIRPTDVLRALSAWLMIFSLVIGSWGVTLFVRSFSDAHETDALVRHIFTAARTLGIALLSGCTLGLVCSWAGIVLARIADDVETMRILAYGEGKT